MRRDSQLTEDEGEQVRNWSRDGMVVEIVLGDESETALVEELLSRRDNFLGYSTSSPYFDIVLCKDGGTTTKEESLDSV